MSPILGIWASQNYPRITNSFESIATVTVGAGGSSSISFSSIPSTYKHLQIRFMGSITSGNQISFMRFNSDTTATNYYTHALEGDGSTAYAYAVNTFPRYTSLPSATSVQGVSVIDILDYTNTSKNSTVRALGGVDRNGSGEVTFYSGLWKNTAAITQIDLVPNSGATFRQYTHAALYGIKG